MNRRIISILFVLALRGQVMAGDLRPEVARSLGCYNLTLGKWNPEQSLGADDAYFESSQVIELTSELYLNPGVNDDWLFVRFVSGGPKVYNSAYWEALRDSRIAITFTTGFSGVSIIAKFNKREMH